MWGVLMHTIPDFRISHNALEVESVVKGKLDLFKFADLNLRDQLLNIWKWKFLKSFASLSAWDTHLEFLMWKTNEISIVPPQSFVRDLGSDFTSSSAAKRRQLSIHSYRKGKVQDFFLCQTCEIESITKVLSRKEKMKLYLNKRMKIFLK
jgi:hypothetical protein